MDGLDESQNLPDRLRAACARVAACAQHVQLAREKIDAYARKLPEPPRLDPSAARLRGGAERERAAAFWLTLDAINFGSGWFPTLRKRPGLSGYRTIEASLRERFERHGPWRAAELRAIEPAEVAAVLEQDPKHELMALYARSLRSLGAHVEDEHGGRFAAVADAAAGSAVALVELLARWECFADVSRYGSLELPFLKRAQIAACDLHRAGAARFADLARLTMFADNLVPHVLRLDGILRLAPALQMRIDAGALLEHGSAEEVELRACAVHAVELLVAARSASCAAAIDELLWNRGQLPPYKARPRPRCRCTAY
jgi:hypothetical protein